MQTLKLNSRFCLAMIVKKADKEKMDKIMEMNKIPYTEWRKHPMDGFIEFRVDTNMRGAELIRQLIKNIKVYD